MSEIDSTQAGAALKVALVHIVGAAHVHDDAATRDLHSQDIWARAQTPVALVAAPADLAQVVAVVQAAAAAGHVIVARGAGMSYTRAYQPDAPRTLALDMRRMDRVVSVNAADMTVTVEPGCTWVALNAALKPLGLRTPFWGPMSGLLSTVGGGISQLNAMLGAGHHGTSSESVIALTVVLGTGHVVRTGARGVDGESPFYRHYGPDLVGLFCGDGGALGIKASITLRLMQAPAHADYASFAFATGPALLEAMAAMARAGVACETCGFDPGLTKVRMQRASLGSDVKTLGAVVGQQKSLVKGLLAAGRIAFAGRDFVGAEDYSLHVIAEGRSVAAVQADIAEARRIAAHGGGQEIANTIAKVIRAVPFPPLNSVLGPGGERWAPVHGILPLSVAPAVFGAIRAIFDDMAQDFTRVGVEVGFLFTSMSTNALIIEPVFYWPGERLPIHAVAIEPAHLAKLPALADDPAATAVVLHARARVIELFRKQGAGHFQIGRTYPYRASRDGDTWQLLQEIKTAVDPQCLLNPGALGLEAA